MPSNVPVWFARRIAPHDLRTDGNIFTLLRWLLASTVMFSHGWDLTQSRAGLDPSVALLTMPVSRLAVFLFFSLSGFLVAGSLIKRGVAEFAWARALRMIPGLWVMLIVTTVGLGLAFSTLAPSEYFRDRSTWHYVLRNGLLLGGEYDLPGVFAGHPFPVVNGSLWTIPQEVRCYIVLALLGAAGLMATRRWLLTGFVIAVAIHLVVPADIIPALENPRRLALSFFLGVLAYVCRDRLWLSWPVAILSAVLALTLAHLAKGSAGGMASIQIGLAYFVLVAAFRVPARMKRWSAAVPDYSYGIYIYAFPAQQTAIALTWAVTPIANILTGLAITLPVAALSWHLVEKPCLQAKRLRGR